MVDFGGFGNQKTCPSHPTTCLRLHILIYIYTFPVTPQKQVPYQVKLPGGARRERTEEEKALKVLPGLPSLASVPGNPRYLINEFQLLVTSELVSWAGHELYTQFPLAFDAYSIQLDYWSCLLSTCIPCLPYIHLCTFLFCNFTRPGARRRSEGHATGQDRGAKHAFVRSPRRLQRVPQFPQGEKTATRPADLP